MRRRNNNNGHREQTRLPVSSLKDTIQSNIIEGRSINVDFNFCAILALLIFFTLLKSGSYQLLDSSVHHILGRSRLHLHQDTNSHRQRETHPIKYVNLIDIQSSQRVFDVIVVGCGPAGITAALFAARMGMTVLVVGSPTAGSLSTTDRIDNFPAFFGDVHGGGQGWIDATLEQASFYGAEFAPPTFMVSKLVKTTIEQHSVFEIHLHSSSVDSSTAIGKAVIIATGSNPRKLNLIHESMLWGRALHNCALCDGDIYVRNNSRKSVAVIGGGDAAVEAILLLHKMGVNTIRWIHRRESYRANPSEVQKIRQLTNVEIWSPYIVVEWVTKGLDDSIQGNDSEAVEFQGIRIIAAKNGELDPEATSSITVPCDGAFLMIGSTPNSHWLASSGIEIDPESKLIRLFPHDDGSMSDITSTSIEGVFAAGEVVDGVYRQALTASSQGAEAAIDVQRYLRRKGFEEFTKQIIKSNDAERKPATFTNSNQVNCDLTSSDCINLIVSTHPVVVFSKTYCPYCRRALEVLHSYSERSHFIKPLVLDLTEVAASNAPAIQDTLEMMTGRRTVPNVFVGGISIGGGDETTALHMSGKLDELLLKANAFRRELVPYACYCMMKSSSSTTVSDTGRSRAMLRVKQKLRSDRLKWSPSGKVRGALRPESRQGGEYFLQRKPWNNRFMFDDEPMSYKCNDCAAKPLGRKAISKPGLSANARKSQALIPSESPKRRCEYIYFTERSNGTPVMGFRRSRKPTSKANQASIGLSPFDMTKVRKALESDCISYSEGYILCRKKVAGILSQGKDRQENEFEFECESPQLVEHSLIKRIEDFLYSIELEEELLRRHINRLTSPWRTTQPCSDSIAMNKSPRLLGSKSSTFLCSPDSNDHDSLVRNQHHRVYTESPPLRYPLIIADIAQSILDSAVEDITSELDEIVSQTCRGVLSSL